MEFIFKKNGTSYVLKAFSGVVFTTYLNKTETARKFSRIFIWRLRRDIYIRTKIQLMKFYFIIYLDFNTNNNQTHFQTPVNQSYSCSSLKQVVVDDHTKVTLDEFHLQAFKSSNSTGFDASKLTLNIFEFTYDIFTFASHSGTITNQLWNSTTCVIFIDF